MQFLDLKNKKWDNISGVPQSGETRLEVYDNVSKSFTKPYCFKPGNDNLKVVKRIGSQSVNGEVYLLRTPAGKYIVGKIMPIVNEKTESDNKNEIKIALKASSLVHSGSTTHFPLVYGSSICENTMYDRSSNFISNSQDWWLRKQIMQSFGGKRARIEGVRFNQQTFGKSFEEKIAYAKQRVPTLDVSKMELESDVLLSELAWGDLETFLQHNLKNMSDEELYQMYAVILDVIMDMQKKLHIVHNDFHSGNMLVVFSDKGVNILAHDFGTAQEKKEFDTYDSLIDVEKITSKLLERHLNHKLYMSPRLYNILSYIATIREKSEKDPMELIVEKWKKLK